MLHNSANTALRMECDATVDTRAHLAVLGVLSIHHSLHASYRDQARRSWSDLKRPQITQLTHAAAAAARPRWRPLRAPWISVGREPKSGRQAGKFL